MASAAAVGIVSGCCRCTQVMDASRIPSLAVMNAGGGVLPSVAFFGNAGNPLQQQQRQSFLRRMGRRKQGVVVVDAKIREIFMPALSSTMTEGKIVSWVKNEGDKLSKGNSYIAACTQTERHTLIRLNLKAKLAAKWQELYEVFGTVDAELRILLRFLMSTDVELCSTHLTVSLQQLQSSSK